MPDKEQIIIDSVIVSGCECSSTTPSSVLCYMKGNKCNDNPNCYYKQLKRKEQEYERLVKDYFKQNEWLKQQAKECEELKKYLEETANILGLNTNATILGKNAIEYWAVLSSSSNDAIKKLQQECKEREQDAENWAYKAGLAIGKASRYLKALEEIEEILDNGTADTQINAAHLVHQHYLARFCDIRDIISKAKAITT